MSRAIAPIRLREAAPEARRPPAVAAPRNGSAPHAENHDHGAEGVDFDLHGLVSVRLLGATPGDVAAVRWQLGPIERRLTCEPDIVVRFVRSLPTQGSVRLLGLGETGFTERDFLVLRGKHHDPIKVQIPFEQLGNRCEIVCQSGIAAVPLLIAIVNLTALARGALPLHAAAFRYQGIGVLVTGWAKGGKTEALLAFMKHGAEYVGDEWVYLDPQGRMFGIPEPIRVWDWHLTDLPQFRRSLPRRSRLKLWTLKRLVGLLQMSRKLIPGDLSAKLVPALSRQLYVQVPPEKLGTYLGVGRVSRPVSHSDSPGEPSYSLAARFDKLVFVASHDSPEVVVRPVDPQEVARRMVFSLQEEQQVLQSRYRMFRFAFPARSNPLIEQSEALQRERLSRFLAGKQAYEVLHPYPAPIPKLFEAIRPLL